MNLKRKVKNFFTLIRKADSGFTLVELIVVIAILAILAGVGVPAYSAYVNKANEAADRQMIADIEQALILGAYSGNYAPGTVVGAVGISKDGNAVAKTTDLDSNRSTAETDIADMMARVFGSGWETTLRLQSDAFANSDSAKMIAAIKANPSLFASVPGSSFYAAEGGTDSVVSEVDDLATALKNVLGSDGDDVLIIWGDAFTKGAFAESGISTTMLDDNSQIAANLTVFAVANELATKDVESLKRSWNGEPAAIDSTNGYVADLAMNYAQCVAFVNYIKENDKNNALIVNDSYADLKAAMEALSGEQSGRRIAFNTAINDFWESVEPLDIAWKKAAEGETSQAEKDAEAFIASMLAVNTLEDTYVTADKTSDLNKADAFEAIGAADILDTMVNYAKLGELPAGEYVITLTLAEDGSPVVTPTLQDD